jgi:hypothetical protein
MYANDKAMAERWEKHTPKGKKLPEKVKKQTNKNAELKSGFKRNSMDVKTQEPSDIQKLAYVAAHDKQAAVGLLGGALIGGPAGAAMSEPGYRADSAGHGALRGAGAGMGATMGGGLGLLASLLAAKKDPSTTRKIIQGLLPVLGAGAGGVAGYGATRALGGESLLEKKRRKQEEEKEGSEKQANLASIIKALKAFGKRTLAPAAGTGLLGYGVGKSKGYGQGFESGQDSIKDMNLKEILDLAMPKLEVAKQASTIQGLAKEAGKRGLWDNVHAKRERGEEPAEKGDKDYPDEKSWKKTTEASK